MQRRVLVRTKGLATFRQALADLARTGTLAAIRRRLVVVPTHAAAELLRQTIEQRSLAAGATVSVLPDFASREDWLRRLHEAVSRDTPMLTRTEREVLLARAAREAMRLRRMDRPPFHLRPGLVSTMLDFYDELRRRQRTVRRFVAALFDELRVERGTDRGSEGLVEQTRFLGSTFLAYERGVARRRAFDEHTLRAMLIEDQPALPFDDLVIGVADHPADPGGLWPADFDLVGRLSGLARVSVVMTDEAHDAGFRERIERELPGIEETRARDVPAAPRLVVPVSDDVPPVFVSRDREEEVRDVARHLREQAAGGRGLAAGPVAIVVHRPLPYLYLTRQVLADARIPSQTFDALPLAAEPYAALLDLVLTVARTRGTREGIIGLLRSSQIELRVRRVPVGQRDVTALDTVLGERRAAGDASTYPDEVEAAARTGPGGVDLAAARRAASAAVLVADRLAPYRTGDTASKQVGTLRQFLRDHERLPTGEDEDAERHRRARAAVLAVLDELTAAFAALDDRPREPDVLAALVRHAIEQRTFRPRRSRHGVHVVDRRSASFGEFNEAYLVGLVEPEWSERPRRSVFYSSGLLSSLGWPQDRDQALAARAAFADLLGLARDRTRLSAFQLEGDSAVPLSPLIDLARGVPTVAEAPVGREAVFSDERLTRLTMPPDLEAGQASWLAARHRRPPLGALAYSGHVGSREAEVYRVSRVDRYVTCPFKYFAEFVLELPEERDEPGGLTPLERGTLLHTLFEQFYAAWQAQGRGAIEGATLPDALALFGSLVDRALEGVGGPDRILERMRLLGSPVTRGVAERVFELEIAAGVDVRRRLLEYDLSGAFAFPVRHGLSTRTIEIRGKVDRIDVLADGSLRVVDYKLGRMPDLDTSVQVAVYAHCARERLEAEEGYPHPIAAATYLAFGEDRRLEGATGGSGQPVAMAVEARASEFAGAVGQIEDGAFPPRPRRVAECAWCGFVGVCRKEYRVEDDGPADAV